MKVILFSDDLKTIHNKEFVPSVICEIEKIDDFPNGLIEVNGKLARCCSISRGDTLTIEWIDKPIDKENQQFTRNIKCPYCGIEDSDSWEASDSDDVVCDTCGSEYFYERDVEVTYCSRITKANREITILK